MPTSWSSHVEVRFNRRSYSGGLFPIDFGGSSSKTRQHRVQEEIQQGFERPDPQLWCVSWKVKEDA